MHHLLAGSRIRLTYLQDHRALARIDWPTIFEDLIDAGALQGVCRWSDLDRLTHVVLASDRESARYAGVLGLIERTTSLEPYLLVEMAMVRPGENDAMLRRAMLAHALARIVCLDGKPVALAAPRGDPPIEAVLRDLGSNIGTALVHPPPDGNVILFRTASLGQRIGSGVTVVDLRPVAEKSLLRDLRGLHGVRTERVKPRASKAKPARSGGATRRPRKATHTGSIG
jgi:hypothetical protein